MKINGIVISKNAVLLLVLALASCPAGECHLLKHLMVSQKHASLPDKTISYHLERLQTATSEKPEEANEEKKGAHSPIDNIVDKVASKVETANFGPIDLMRGEMCLAQHRIIVHSKCMNWLVKKCTGKFRETAICDRTRAAVKSDCEDPDNENSEAACEWARLLGIDVNPRKKKEKEEENKAEEAEEKKAEETTKETPAEPEEHKLAPAATPVAEETKTEAPTAPAPATEETATKAPATAEKEEAPTKAPTTAEKEEVTTKAPAPAAKEEASTEGSKSAAEEAPKKEEVQQEAGANPGYEDPQASLVKGGLAAQGFSGKKVKHIDQKTVAADWQNEYGHHKEKKSGAQLWTVHPLICLAIGAMAIFF